MTAAVLLAAVLMAAAFALPLSANGEHAAGHLALALPTLGLLALAMRTWPAAGPEVAPRLARITLLLGFAVAAAGLLAESVGAFGYADDQRASANSLTLFHDLGVAIWPVGFSAVMAGTIMSLGVQLARWRGSVDSRITTWSAVLALAAVVAFNAGGFVFGY